MTSRYVTVLLGLACCVAFFASRASTGLAQGSDQYTTLITQLYKGPVKRSLLNKFKQAGTPALDAALDDFASSQFVQQTSHQLGKNFNPGKAFERSVYASNVVKVAEAFGSTGVRELVRRQPPALVKRTQMDTPAFRKLGAGVIQPLLTMEMLRTLPASEAPKAEAWVSNFAETRKIREQNPGAVFIVPAICPFAEAVAAGLVAEAVYHAGEWAWDKLFGDDIHADVRSSFWTSQLSPTTRRRLLLRQLNPAGAG